MPGETEETRKRFSRPKTTSSTQNNHTGQSGGNPHSGFGSYSPPTNTGGSYGGGEPEAYVPYGGDPYGGYDSAMEQYVGSLKDYNQMYGVAGGGVGLGSSGAMFYTDVPDVYYSTYVPGTQGYSPTGYQHIAGPGALYENGQLVEGFVDRGIYNPYGGGGGGGGYGGYGGYGGGRGGSDGGQGGYIYDMGGGFPQTYQRGQVGPGSLQEQVNQAYLSGGKGFARGGIVSLLRL